MKPWKERLEQFLKEYGTIALIVWFSLFGLVLAGAYLAIRFGFKPEGVGGNLVGFGAAYAFAKLTMPLRLLATLAVTPLVARLSRRAAPVRSEPPAG